LGEIIWSSNKTEVSPSRNRSAGGDHGKPNNGQAEMKILLQDSDTKLFFRSGNIWTSNPDAAFHFQQSPEVFQFIEEQNLSQVQLVVKFENPRRYEVVPLKSAT
jgi:hypothetical protein